MQRINALTMETAPEGSKKTLEAINSNFGKVPNIFASLANSPAALNALMGVFGALDSGTLAGAAHEAIALRVGELNGCKYCTAAHTGKARMAGVSEEDTVTYRKGESSDPKIKALLDFAESLVKKGTGISDEEVDKAKAAGLSDAELLEALAIVVCNIFTNYTNALVKTEVDFPPAPEL
ncbi:MAG: carboxymuconolactone decarboxylase family protein [Planctomycetota bacterium]|jgi:uncharacterized peroxidase-related enzyme